MSDSFPCYQSHAPLICWIFISILGHTNRLQCFDMKSLSCFLLALTCMILGLPLFAQDSFSAYSGDTFHVGDHITFGYPSILVPNNISYQYIMDVNPDHMFGMTEVNRRMDGSEGIVKGFMKGDKIYTDETLMLVTASDGRELYLRTDKAINSGELVVRNTPPSIFPDAVELTPRLAFAMLLKVNKNSPKEYLKQYLYVAKRDLWDKVHNDEFEYHAVEASELKELESVIEGIDFGAVYYFKDNYDTGIYMGKYDFDAKGYKMVLDENKQGLLTIPFDASMRVYLMLSNIATDFGTIPLNVEEAKRVRMRLNNGSQPIYPRNKIYVKLNPDVTKADYDKLLFGSQYEGVLLSGKMVGIEIYDFGHCEYNFIAYKKL